MKSGIELHIVDSASVTDMVYVNEWLDNRPKNCSPSFAKTLVRFPLEFNFSIIKRNIIFNRLDTHTLVYKHRLPDSSTK